MINKIASFCAAFSVSSGLCLAQSIPPGDRWQFKDDDGATTSFGGAAKQDCQQINPIDNPTAQMRVTHQVTIKNRYGRVAVETFEIQAPDVKHPISAVVPSLPLLAGSRVYIYACGCVQTGGKGKTWKSYVYPQGPKSGKYYFGTVGFYDDQGLPMTMRRVSDYVQNPSLSFPILGNHSQMMLGYSDDHYNDNGYLSHDNGTQDQCKGVGPASLEVAIFYEQ